MATKTEKTRLHHAIERACDDLETIGREKHPSTYAVRKVIFDLASAWLDTDVASAAESIIAETKGLGSRKRGEAIEEQISETADSAVTYTADALTIILVSPNDGAYEDEMGEKPPSDEARAAFAFAADLREEVQRQLGDEDDGDEEDED